MSFFKAIGSKADCLLKIRSAKIKLLLAIYRSDLNNSKSTLSSFGC